MAMKIEIPDVPDDLYQQLEAQAAKKSMALSDFLLVELRRIAERPGGGAELLDRLGEVFRRAAASSRERQAAKEKIEKQ